MVTAPSAFSTSRAARTSFTRRRRIRRPILPRSTACSTADPGISHVFAVQCETTSGIRNPIKAIADVVARHGRRLLLDAMSAFGALELDCTHRHFRCRRRFVEQVHRGRAGPRLRALPQVRPRGDEGQRHHLVLDLFDQAQNFEKTGQYRFTPPIHVIVAFHQALEEFWAEGGVVGTRRALRRQRQGPDRRHARTRLRDAAAGRPCRRRSS